MLRNKKRNVSRPVSYLLSSFAASILFVGCGGGEDLTKFGQDVEVPKDRVVTADPNDNLTRSELRRKEIEETHKETLSPPKGKTKRKR